MRRGVFVVDYGQSEIVLTPNEIWHLHPGVPYRIRHPHGGDDCTILRISATLQDEYRATRGPGHPMTASRGVFRAQSHLRALARRGEAESLASEEIVRSILIDAFASFSQVVLNSSHQRLVRRTQELLSTRYAERLTLSEIGTAVGSSPYHLARVFRRATGQTLHRYQTSLRVRAALERLSRGERDLAALALDLGFCDQSHFTNTFRAEFGNPPSQFRPRNLM